VQHNQNRNVRTCKNSVSRLSAEQVHGITATLCRQIVEDREVVIPLTGMYRNFYACGLPSLPQELCLPFELRQFRRAIPG
jgi:hypothetical protein